MNKKRRTCSVCKRKRNVEFLKQHKGYFICYREKNFASPNEKYIYTKLGVVKIHQCVLKKRQMLEEQERKAKNNTTDFVLDFF